MTTIHYPGEMLSLVKTGEVYSLSVEAMPPYDHSVHRFLLVHKGITHLDGLASARACEFLLIVTPLRLPGSTGSWVHPIAIA